MEVDLTAKRERWARDRLRWEYVIGTYWQHDYDAIVRILAQSKTLDEAEAAAARERGGMVAT